MVPDHSRSQTMTRENYFEGHKCYSITRISTKRSIKERLEEWMKIVLLAIGYIDLGALAVAAGYIFTDWSDRMPLVFWAVALVIMLISIVTAITEAAKCLNDGRYRK